jgi:AcrR family transcriptional regulator
MSHLQHAHIQSIRGASTVQQSARCAAFAHRLDRRPAYAPQMAGYNIPARAARAAGAARTKRMDTAEPMAGEKKSRKASKEIRKQQLIEATIDSLAKRGYAETTLANVADGAKLSRGIVNFHFESKENLLIATLQFMADEYAQHWSAALEKAGPSAAERMWALVAADFDRRMTTKRKLAAWCAFWGEAKSRPTYQALCGARDLKYQRTFEELCAEMKVEGGYGYDAEAAALAICSSMEGLWLRLMMSDGLTREAAHKAAIECIIGFFPKHIGREGPINT